MCGVFGIFGETNENKVNRVLIQADRGLFHRGPDSGSHVLFTNGALLSRRLAIVDRSGLGEQPMCTPDNRHWLVYNGMLYNYRELREELKNDFEFRSACDTEVVLAALATWGTTALRRLQGMFALLWWDSRKSELIGAVDQLGIKPLLYRHERHGVLTCCSELGPLVDADVNSSVDLDVLGTYLNSGALDHSDRTLVSGVKQLRGGEFLCWNSGSISVKRYFDWNSEVVPLEDMGSDELIESLRFTLESSVRKHLLGDSQVGLGLSAGLDSNLLRILLPQDSGAQRVKFFTYATPGTRYDESEILTSVDAEAGRQTTRVPVSQETVMRELPTVIEHTLEPLGGLGTLGISMVYKAASQHGIKVMMSGEGSDDLFGGYARYADLQNVPNLSNDRTRQILIRASDGSLMGGPPLDRHFEFSEIQPDLTAALKYSSGLSPLKVAMWSDLLSLKLPKLLKFRDRVSMMHSVESRVPFLDLPLVLMALALPDRYLVSDGVTKVALRAIASKTALRDIGHSKLGNPVPQREWIKGSLGAWVDGLTVDSILVKRGIVDGSGFRNQLAIYRASPELGNSFFAWQFANLELWMRAFESRRTNGGYSDS